MRMQPKIKLHAPGNTPIKLTGGMAIKVRIFGQQSSDQASGKLVAISTIW